jgi:putative membrane protein
MGDLLAAIYPWSKALHIIAVISWMAGLLYLPRLFVHHVERAAGNAEMTATFEMMERKLLRFIMNPAMVVSWVMGICLVFTPGVVDLSSDIWLHIKFVLIIIMSLMHHRFGIWRKELAAGTNTRTGRYFRMMNEVPTLAMIGIVVLAVVRPF